MPIVNIQRRMAEKGRIRLGHKGAKGQPVKLTAFRFTSPDRALIEQIAQTYGGDVQDWDNAGKAEFEVYTDARSIPVIVVKGGFSQWYEEWSKAGCLHRCDGEKDVTGAACDPGDPHHIAATEKPTTRLSVMLEEIETLGVWRMESKGWNAAAELPSMAELAMHVGDLVPATLSLVERSSIIQVNGRPQTSRFVVPVLDLTITKRRLIEIAGGLSGAPALESGRVDEAHQLEAARPDYFAQVDAAQTTDAINVVWQAAHAAGHMDDRLMAHMKARGTALVAAESTAPADEPVEATVDEDDVAALWQQIIATAGAQGLSTSQVEAALLSNYDLGGIYDLTVEQAREYLAQLTTEATS